jgi:hypothetical protein
MRFRDYNTLTRGCTAKGSEPAAGGDWVALEGGLVHHARLGAGPFLIAQSKNVQTQQQKARNCMDCRKLLQ